jgi:hypothetical protein
VPRANVTLVAGAVGASLRLGGWQRWDGRATIAIESTLAESSAAVLTGTIKNWTLDSTRATHALPGTFPLRPD